jgi:cytochrome c oxidase assembly protein subunit 15
MEMHSFRKLAVFSLGATLLLVAIGGLVRSTGSGLGCSTSWPDCSGKLIPDFHNYKVVIEFSHRLVAGIVMLLIATMAVKARKLRAEHPRLFMPSLVALGLVLFQAGLGALVVKLELEAESVVLHLSAAMSVVAALIYVLGVATSGDRRAHGVTDAALSRKALFAALSVLVLLLVGSFMSGHESASLAFTDWPLMDGSLVPALSDEGNAIHFLHRVLALAVGVFLVTLMLAVLRRKAELPLGAKLVHAAVGLFAIEVLIGAANVWSGLDAAFVTAHLTFGALIWASLVGLAVVTSPGIAESAPARNAGIAGQEA